MKRYSPEKVVNCINSEGFDRAFQSLEVSRLPLEIASLADFYLSYRQRLDVGVRKMAEESGLNLEATQ